jgi:uncharacterized membrane protein YeiH
MLIEKIPVFWEGAAVIIGALSGGVHAAKSGADIVGIFVLALATSLGGGMLRDILIADGPPAALVHPMYLIVVAVASFVTLFLASWLARVQRLLVPLDALLLGLWTLIGLERAMAHHLPLTSAIFLGTMTATGGGIIRDVLSGSRPDVLSKGELNVTAAFLAAVVGAGASRVPHAPPVAGEVGTILVGFGLRLAAVRWHLTAPSPGDLPRWLRGRGPKPPAP